MKVLRCGEDGLLVEPDDPASALALAQAFRAVDGVVEAVTGARTVLLRTDRDVDWLRARLDMPLVLPEPAGDAGAVTIDVRYDGPDRSTLADELDLDADVLVRLHTSGVYVVAFCGFVPGFAYLTGLDPRLHAPRLAEPRTRVPAGAVGVAGEFTGAYPRESPGGWRLLGRTDAALWDAGRAQPALLTPGTKVRFRAVG